MIATYTIPMRAPSVNGLYISKYKGRGKTISKEGLKFKNFVKYHVTTDFTYDKTTHALEVEIFFYIKDLFTKTKVKTISDRSGDLDNFLKVSIDSVFSCLGINDSQICKITTQKLEAENDCIVFILKTFPLSLVRQRAAL
jgi:Holliday junction resolvase RusA-like endonuclease